MYIEFSDNVYNIYGNKIKLNTYPLFINSSIAENNQEDNINDYEYYYRFRLYPKIENNINSSVKFSQSQNIIVNDSFNILNQDTDNFKGNSYKFEKYKGTKIPKFGRANIFKIENYLKIIIYQKVIKQFEINCNNNNIMKLFSCFIK